MKLIKYIKLLAASTMLVVVMMSCNKDLEQFPDIIPPVNTGQPLGQALGSNSDDTLYYTLVKRAGLLDTINNNARTLTLFVANNASMKQFINIISGGAVPLAAPDAVIIGFINANLPVETAAAIVQYNILPQKVMSSNISDVFPNMKYPTLLNPAPSVSELLRFDAYLSTRNGAWFNNVPITAVDQQAGNGVIHHTAILNTPPQRFLWNRIDTDPELTYLKAAIQRADSGVVDAGPIPSKLQSLLSFIGADFTVFAPTDDAFRAALTAQIYQAILPLFIQQLTQIYISMGMTPDDAAAQAAIDAPPIALQNATNLASSPTVFSNPQLFPFIPARTVQGLIAYHLLGVRAFTNNFPTSTLAVPTLLNRAIPAHPGVAIEATFGAPFVSAATVKGAANPTPSNIIINASPLTPDPAGTSDQNFVNGVLHKIDQVLFPQ